MLCSALLPYYLFIHFLPILIRLLHLNTFFVRNFTTTLRSLPVPKVLHEFGSKNAHSNFIHPLLTICPIHSNKSASFFWEGFSFCPIPDHMDPSELSSYRLIFHSKLVFRITKPWIWNELYRVRNTTRSWVTTSAKFNATGKPVTCWHTLRKFGLVCSTITVSRTWFLGYTQNLRSHVTVRATVRIVCF